MNRRMSLSVLICAIFLLIAPSSFAGDWSYYFTMQDSTGQQTLQIAREADDSLITIIPAEGMRGTDIVDQCIDPDIPPVTLTETCQVYHLMTGYGTDSALELLYENPQVEMAFPVLKNAETDSIEYVTERVTVVATNSSVMSTLISKLENDLKCQVVEQGGMGSFQLEVEGSILSFPDYNDGYTYVEVRMTRGTADEMGLKDPFAFSRYLHDEVPEAQGAAPNFKFKAMSADLDFDKAAGSDKANSEGGRGEDTADPLRPAQWHLDDASSKYGISHDEASLLLPESNVDDVYIILIDVAFDTTHEDLSGVTDDIAFTYDAADKDYDVSPPDGIAEGERSFWGRGTNRLGLLAARANNGIGVYGMSPHYKYILIKIASNDEGYCDMATAWRAFQAVALLSAWNKADIVATGCYFIPSDPLTMTIDLIDKYQGVFIAPLGDKGGNPCFPACDMRIMSVTAYNQYGLVEGEIDDTPDVTAPGVDLWSIDPMGDLGSNPGIARCNGDPNYFCRVHGPGAAAYIAAGVAAGVAALAPEYRSPGYPLGAPLSFVRQVIRRGTTNWYPGAKPQTGFGRINQARTYALIAAGDADGSGAVDIDDVVYLINYIFGGGPAPVPYEWVGDSDCSGGVDIDDVVYLINFIFGNGPSPHKQCVGHLDQT